MYEKLCIKLFTVLRSEKGQTLVEYALLLVLIAVVLIIMVRGTGQEVNSVWSRINSGINQ
jgi:pilus assembly protein Flp/PilA